jgi:hypothetical protein
MKRYLLIFAVALVGAIIGTSVTSQVVIEQRPLSQRGLTEGMSFGTALPTVANSGQGPFDGEPFIVRSTGADPLLRVFNDSTSSWDTTPMLENANVWSGSNSYSVFREDFAVVQYHAMENDGTAAVVTDASVNVLMLHGPGTIGQIGYRIEAPGGPGLAATPAPAAAFGVFTVDGYVDDIDNEGIQFTFGAQDNATSADGGLGGGIVFNETSSNAMYCEAQIDFANISAVDDAWFGWVTNDATDNPPASATFDTAALFTIVDATGDINITTMLNDGAETSDDTGVDMVDGDQMIFRVAISADAVTFAAEFDDGGSTVEAVTQTLAVLNADDGDVLKCVFGFTNVAAESYGVTINYVEIGDGT